MMQQHRRVVERGGAHAIVGHDGPRIILRRIMTSQPPQTRRGPEPPDLSERGGVKNGEPQRSDRRLFMQFLAFGGCENTRPLVEAAAAGGFSGVLYEDVNDPRGVALVTVSEDPAFFLDRVRPMLNGPPFRPFVQTPEYTRLDP